MHQSGAIGAWCIEGDKSALSMTVLFIPLHPMQDHRIHLRPPVWLPLIVAVILGGSFIVGKQIEVAEHEDDVVISVTGEGKVSGAPDIALMNFGVQTGRVETANEATEMLAEKMTAIIDALAIYKIAEKDISTASVSLNPAYDWSDGKREDRGFEGQQTLNVKVRDLDVVGDVLTAATRAGANQVGQVSFTIDDPESLRSEARDEAIAQAKEKAKHLAKQLGKSLGEVRGFSESGRPQPMYMRMEMDAVSEASIGGGPSMAIPAGEQDVRVTVTVSYELE